VTTQHVHRFAVICPHVIPGDASCRSVAVDDIRDKLEISVHNLSALPGGLALIESRQFYDLGDSVLICHNGFGMQVDFSVRHLEIYLAQDDHWELVTSSILNIGLSAATYFRGELPFHAGAVSLDGQFVGILGKSDTGKSTLVWSLVQEGALFGNDDLLMVQVDGETPIAMPSVSLYPNPRDNSNLIAGIGETPAVRNHPDSDRLWMHIQPHQRLTEPQPLRCFFKLEPDETCERISAHRWGEKAGFTWPSDLEAVFDLQNHLYGPHFGRAFVGAKTLEKRLLKLAEKVPVFVLRYPKRFDQIPLLIETMRSLIA